MSVYIYIHIFTNVFTMTHMLSSDHDVMGQKCGSQKQCLWDGWEAKKKPGPAADQGQSSQKRLLMSKIEPQNRKLNAHLSFLCIYIYVYM